MMQPPDHAESAAINSVSASVVVSPACEGNDPFVGCRQTNPTYTSMRPRLVLIYFTNNRRGAWRMFV